MAKVNVSFQITVEGGCPSHAYEASLDYAYGFEQLQRALEDAVELFKLRQKKYQRDYIENWGKDPFAETARNDNSVAEARGAPVAHDGCNYMWPIGEVCNKCGAVYQRRQDD